MENKANLKKCIAVFLGYFFLIGNCFASSNSGKDYTNFGADLVTPIFPKSDAVGVYKNKTDSKPIALLKDIPLVYMERDQLNQCFSKNTADGWVFCNVSGANSGWIRRSEFLSPSEYKPVENWPFRYWIYVSSTGVGEEGVMMYRAVPRFPYLIKPEEFDNIFFLVYFDQDGFAISPKTQKKTGDRVFVVDDGVYLAPNDPSKREKANWLFLGFYNKEMQAICPAKAKDSCYSSVNLSPSWPGIKAFYTSPGPQFAHDGEIQKKKIEKSQEAWYGYEEVAFARHSDPVVPLTYKVPANVFMSIDSDKDTDEQRAKNHNKPFCLVDCKGVPNTVKLNPSPALH